MQPIVHGLEEIYSEGITFIEANAGEGNGEKAFRQKNLPGHPAYLIVKPDGTELWRGIGEQPQQTLEAAIQDVIES